MADRLFLTRKDVDAIPDGDELSAARMHLELEHQHDSLGEGFLGGNGQDELDTRHAQEHLRRRFPHAHKVARHETSEALGGLPRHLRNVQERERDEAGLDAHAARAERAEHRKTRERSEPREPAAPRAPRAPRTPAAPASRRAATARRGGRRVSARSRRRARRFTRAITTGPSGGGSVSAFAFQAAGTAIGLSVLYLLLTHGRAVSALSSGFGQAFAKLVSPHHDVFGGGPATAAPALTLGDVAGTGVTGVTVDVSKLPHLTSKPPTVPRVNAPRAPAVPTTTRLATH